MTKDEKKSPAAFITGLIETALPLVAQPMRPLVVVVGLVAVVAVVAPPYLNDDKVAGWILGSALVTLLAIACLFFVLARHATGEAQGNPARLVASVNGLWWQLIRNEKTPGLSLIRIELSPFPGLHRLSGDKYLPDGQHQAQWWSRAVAPNYHCATSIFYIWDGSYDDWPGTVSGVGTFQFPGALGDVPESGSGWFTTGNVDQLNFKDRSSVVLRRATTDQVETMRGDDEDSKSELIASLYAKWRGAKPPPADAAGEEIDT